MSLIIDLDLPLPPTAEQIAQDMKRWALGRGEKGMANYQVRVSAHSNSFI
ncbi:MAG: hypothetical protein OEU26_35090 [Candidatus Tectomicrobia bacterium]|nr:hypothetical protein [Candidatus Tectomicrobia bacterium]